MPHPPQKIWRALTQAVLIEQWLMKNDFEPVVGHRFNFRAAPINGWNGVTDCEVLEIILFSVCHIAGTHRETRRLTA